MKKGLMIFKSEFSEPMRKFNKLNCNSTGIKSNFNNGQLQENKNNRIMLPYKNIIKKMMLKLGS